MKKILFIIPGQYGYHTDSYKYCEILAEKYHYMVAYLGLNLGKEIRGSKLVDVHLVSAGNSFKWRIGLLLEALKLEKKYRFDIVFIHAFPLCLLSLLILPRKNLILDIRTSYIEGRYKSLILNKLLKAESFFFRRISVISWGVADFLKLDTKKCCLLPLGGDEAPFHDKDMNVLSLLYVGTFYDRHIEKTIEGFSLFIKKYPFIEAHYRIIGMGSDYKKKKICNAIEKNGLKHNCIFVGEKRHEELYPFFQNHNIGVSYIPLTKYYDCQPPTKTYEYLLNTMVVLATPTSENRKVINASNGIVLAGDSPEDVASGLEQIWFRRKEFNFNSIFNEAKSYTWNQIVKTYLLSIIESN